LQAGSLLLGVAGRLWRFGATAVLGVGLRCPLHDHIRAGRETLAQREDLALDLGNRHLAARGARFEFSHGRLVLARPVLWDFLLMVLEQTRVAPGRGKIWQGTS
jgi:hypothetical protein